MPNRRDMRCPECGRALTIWVKGEPIEVDPSHGDRDLCESCMLKEQSRVATVARLAHEAIQIQDASNLRGVLLAWHKAICNENVPRGGQIEEFLNVLYLSKVASLLRAETDSLGSCRVGMGADFRMAYDWAKRAEADPE